MNQVLEKILKKTKSIDNADFLFNVFGESTDHAKSGNIPIVLFGAGSAGKELLPLFRIHNIRPICFCDNNSSEANFFMELPVVSFNTLKEKYKNSYIVITSGRYISSIRQQLLDNGFSNNQIFALNPYHLFYYTHIHQWYWFDEDVEYYGDKLEKVYHLLADEKSKDLFISKIALLAKGSDFKSYESFVNSYSEFNNASSTNVPYDIDIPLTHLDFETESENYYFDNDVLEFQNNEIYIDGGAFNGDTAFFFMEYCKKNNLSFGKYFLFEPDPDNYNQLERNLSRFQNMICFNLGLWSDTRILKFKNSKEFLSPKSSKITDEPTDVEIKTVSIDEMFLDKNVTFIKMDIEGAEIEALKGGINTIRKYNPKLAICVYHKRNDIFEIPLLIHEICPEYKFFFRHYSRSFEDTILFAEL